LLEKVTRFSNAEQRVSQFFRAVEAALARDSSSNVQNLSLHIVIKVEKVGFFVLLLVVSQQINLQAQILFFFFVDLKAVPVLCLS